MNMNTCPVKKKYRPLPLRREFWRTLPGVIRSGVVLCARNMLEREDVRNAAQSILIDYIESRLMVGFERPKLPDIEFYAAFFSVYYEYIRTIELRIWEEIGNEVDDALRERPDRELTEKEAAFMTIAFLGHPEPPQGIELYANLAVYARTYEELLVRKYEASYVPELFYGALRKHMPQFLFRLIATDSITSVLLTMNAIPEQNFKESKTLLEPNTVLDSRFFRLDEDDSFDFLPRYVEAVNEHARGQRFPEDGVGRTEDRGCPVLYAAQRKNIVAFGVNEIIEQHRARFTARY